MFDVSAIWRRQRVTHLSWGWLGASAKRASSHELVDNSLATLRAFPPWRHDRQPTATGIQLSRRSYHRPGEDNARRMSPREDPAILDDVRVRAREFPDVSDERIKRDPMIIVLATSQRSSQNGYLSPNRVLKRVIERCIIMHQRTFLFVEYIFQKCLIFLL